MKNLKKLSRKELKTINGGIQGCYILQNGTLYCPCKPTDCRINGVCVPVDGITCFP